MNVAGKYKRMMIACATVLMLSVSAFAASPTPLPGNTVVTAVGSTDLSGVLQEVINLLPVVIPVMIGFIAIRKGVSFLRSVLHSA